MSDTGDADWLVVLREACAASTQAAVAKQIGYSATVVNQVLKGSYRGDMRSVQAAVEGALMDQYVDCPVIGELRRDRCLEYQRRGFAATNPLRVALSQACPKCPHWRGRG